MHNIRLFFAREIGLLWRCQTDPWFMSERRSRNQCSDSTHPWNSSTTSTGQSKAMELMVFTRLRLRLNGNGRKRGGLLKNEQKIFFLENVWHTQTFSSLVDQAWVAHFCVPSYNSRPHERMSCFAPCLTLYLSRCSTTHLPLRTGQIPVHRNQDFCLAVLLNRARSRWTTGSEGSQESSQVEKQAREDLGHVFWRNWCVASVEVSGLVDEIELNRWRSLAAVSWHEKTQTSFQFWFVKRAGMVKRGPHVVVNGKVTHSTLHFISGGVHQSFSFVQNHFDMRQRTEHEITSRCCDSSMHGSASDSTGTTRGWSHGQRSCGHGSEVKGRWRTHRISDEQHTSVRMADDSPVLSWLPRYAAQVMNKMRVGSDGKTGEPRRTGEAGEGRWRKWESQVFSNVGEDDHSRKFCWSSWSNRSSFVQYKERCVWEAQVGRDRHWAMHGTRWIGLASVALHGNLVALARWILTFGLVGGPWFCSALRYSFAVYEQSHSWQRRSGASTAKECGGKNSRGWAMENIRVVLLTSRLTVTLEVVRAVRRWHRMEERSNYTTTNAENGSDKLFVWFLTV